jgi:hypothetical protein
VVAVDAARPAAQGGHAPLAGRSPALEKRTVRVYRQFVGVPGGLQLGPPKFRAGIRVVSFPAAIFARTLCTTWTRSRFRVSMG